MDFTVVAAAVATPTSCVFCRTHAHPEGFVERGRTITGYGRVYECAGCAKDSGKAFGMVERAQFERVVAIAQERDEIIARLQAELAVANSPANKVVPLDQLGTFIKENLADVIDLEDERKKRRPLRVKDAG